MAHSGQGGSGMAIQTKDAPHDARTHGASREQSDERDILD